MGSCHGLLLCEAYGGLTLVLIMGLAIIYDPLVVLVGTPVVLWPKLQHLLLRLLNKLALLEIGRLGPARAHAQHSNRTRPRGRPHLLRAEHLDYAADIPVLGGTPPAAGLTATAIEIEISRSGQNGS